MAIDFPNTPDLNQTYSSAGRTWLWNGEKWVIFDNADSVSNQLYDIMVMSIMETD